MTMICAAANPDLPLSIVTHEYYAGLYGLPPIERPGTSQLIHGSNRNCVPGRMVGIMLTPLSAMCIPLELLSLCLSRRLMCS